MGSIIECVKRIYNIQTSNGIKVQIESDKHLNRQTTAKLLENDNEIKDISSILENCKILDIEKVFDKISTHKKSKIRRKKTSNISESRPDIDNATLAPYQRFSKLIQMQGEFTRIDYQKLIEDSGRKISDYMGYGDIEDAVALRRIEPVGKRVPKQFIKYIVTDSRPIEEYEYREMMKNHREIQRHKDKMIQVEA